MFGLGVLVVAATVIAAGIASAGGAGLFAKARYDEIAADVVPPEDLIAGFPSGGARIYDRHGRLLYEFVDRLHGLRRPVPLHEISPWMLEATISTEDASFYENSGLNVRGLIRAAIENLTPLSGGDLLEGSGGSSITQQLAKNVYIPIEERTVRSIDRKVRETVIALELTEQYSKDQILEWYLNSISYGGIYTGVQAAAEGYFGKDAADLTLAEASLLAGIPQSPARYAPLEHVITVDGKRTLDPASLPRLRQLQVIDLMEERGAITPAEAQVARDEPITFREHRFEIEAPHFVLGRVAEEIRARFGERALFEDGLEVTTTLDLDLQHMAEEILEDHIVQFGEPTGLRNGALVAIDPRTGQILTYVGSRDYFRESIQGRNDNAIGLNSPGSTLKPFTFMTAFMKGWGTGTAILDTPFSMIDPGTGEVYRPRDPIAQLQGPMTAASALGNSLNITAVKTIRFAGVDETVRTLKRVGFTSLDTSRGYGPALTVGGVDITLLDEVIGFSVLAAGGALRGQERIVDPADHDERAIEPVSLLRVEDVDGRLLYEFDEPVEEQVVPPQFPYLVTSILSDGSNQCITYGVCNALALPDGRPSAAKTGTSEPFENSRAIGETWTIGYTPNLVAGVWSGNADNAPIVGIDSTRVSFRTWRDFMVRAAAHLELPPEPFQRPPGVVSREVCWPSGRLPTDLCPEMNRYESLFAASVLPKSKEDRPEAYDSWWQRVPIDARTNRPAGSTTPISAVREVVRLVFPPEEIAGWGGLWAWAAANGVAHLIAGGAPGSAESSLPAFISSPSEGSSVSGEVAIRGRASSREFERYTLEWGSGESPRRWTPLRVSLAPISDGTLGVWNTAGLQPGTYRLRLTVLDAKSGPLTYEVGVSVTARRVSDRPGEPPRAWLLSPREGAIVNGQVTVSGFADAGLLRAVIVEVGSGVNPAQWTEIGRLGRAVKNQTMVVWNTAAFPDGPYTVRLTVVDDELGTAQAIARVFVRNGG